MHPVLIAGKNFEISSFSLCLAMAFIAGIIYSKKRSVPSVMAGTDFFNLAFICLISGMAGARLGFIILDPGKNKAALYQIICSFSNPDNQGLMLLGGVLPAFFMSFFYLRWKKIPVYAALDAISPSLLLGISLGRIGCLLNGCCYGKPTHFSFPLGMDFSGKICLAALYQSKTGADFLIATQIMGTIGLLVIFLLVLHLERFKKTPGQTIMAVAVFYSLYRFGMDFMRAYPSSYYWKEAFTYNQIICVFILIVWILLIIVPRQGLYRRIVYK